jgi:hypothetical protein
MFEITLGRWLCEKELITELSKRSVVLESGQSIGACPFDLTYQQFPFLLEEDGRYENLACYLRYW